MAFKGKYRKSDNREPKMSLQVCKGGNTMALVPVSEDAKEKRYYKYYAAGIRELTEEQNAYVENARRDGEKALLPSDMNKALEPGAFCLEETGYYYLKDGGVLIASLIPMPDVTAEMLYWWFAWHPLEPLRYSIWDPEEHYDVQINEEGRRRSTDPEVPLEEKTWGADHVVVESLAPYDKPVSLDINFRNPAEMGVDPERIGGPGCEFIVTANALNSGVVPAFMLESAKKIDGVMHLQVFFWVGYHAIDGKPVKIIPEDFVIPEPLSKLLFRHSIKEFENLAKILPQVFEEERNNW